MHTGKRALGMATAAFLSLLSACGSDGGSTASGQRRHIQAAGLAGGTTVTFTSPMVATTLEGSTAPFYTARAVSSSGAAVTYWLSGPDASKLSINSSSGEMGFSSPPNFSSPTSAGGENDYHVTINASDGSTASTWDVTAVVAQNIGSRPYTWSNGLWGSGGYITGVIFQPNYQGLVYARTDVGGAYRRDSGSSTWTPINDGTTPDNGDDMGVLSLAIDPNNTQMVYEAVGLYVSQWAKNGAILRSSDRGNTWQRVTLPVKLGGNEDGRGAGERLQVDPNLGSILFLGTSQDGLYKSTNSGVTWTQVSGFPTTAKTTFVAFDTANSTHGSATRNIYVGVASTAGPNLYRSTDGGTTWSSVPGAPTGLNPLQGKFDGWGNMYVVYADTLGPNGASNGAVYKYSAGGNSWTNVTPIATDPSHSISFGYGAVSVSVQNPNVIMVSTFDRWNSGDEVFRSTDGGASWTSMSQYSSHSAPNNPWVVAFFGGSLGHAMGGWLTSVAIDPYDGNHVLYTGLWESGNAMSNAITWNYNNAGIEETVIEKVISPNSGAHLLTVMGDNGGARYTSNFNDNSGYFKGELKSNWDIDVAELNPNIVVRTTDGTSFGAYISQDNGVTWSQMPATPATTNDSGAIALSIKGNYMVWVPGPQSAYYSGDGGQTWTASTGYPTSSGVNSGSFFRPVADRGNKGNSYFYTYDFSTGRILMSSDNGKTFNPIYTGLDILPFYASHSQLLSVPGINRRDLWLGTPNGLWHIAGASTGPVKIANVQSAFSVGYGAPAPGQTYYAIYITGSVNNVYGLYQSIDGGNTWTRINDDQHQYGGFGSISGDPRVYGRVYAGAGARGVIIGNR